MAGIPPRILLIAADAADQTQFFVPPLQAGLVLPMIVNPLNPNPNQPPFPWALGGDCTFQALAPTPAQINNPVNGVLVQHVSGVLRCRSCNSVVTATLDIALEVSKVAIVLARTRVLLCSQIPDYWHDNVEAPLVCCHCSASSWKILETPGAPLRNINWLFLFGARLLSQLSTLQLKYYCTVRGLPSYSNKRKILYQIYLDIVKQVDPHCAVASMNRLRLNLNVAETLSVQQLYQ